MDAKKRNRKVKSTYLRRINIFFFVNQFYNILKFVFHIFASGTCNYLRNPEVIFYPRRGQLLYRLLQIFRFFNHLSADISRVFGNFDIITLSATEDRLIVVLQGRQRKKNQ